MNPQLLIVVSFSISIPNLSASVSQYKVVIYNNLGQFEGITMKAPSLWKHSREGMTSSNAIVSDWLPFFWNQQLWSFSSIVHKTKALICIFQDLLNRINDMEKQRKGKAFHFFVVVITAFFPQGAKLMVCICSPWGQWEWMTLGIFNCCANQRGKLSFPLGGFKQANLYWKNPCITTTSHIFITWEPTGQLVEWAACIILRKCEHSWISQQKWTTFVCI